MTVYTVYWWIPGSLCWDVLDAFEYRTLARAKAGQVSFRPGVRSVIVRRDLGRAV